MHFIDKICISLSFLILLFRFVNDNSNQNVSAFLKLKIVPGEIYTISTKKLLGSTVKVQPKANDDNLYFQVSSLKMQF